MNEKMNNIEGTTRKKISNGDPFDELFSHPTSYSSRELLTLNASIVISVNFLFAISRLSQSEVMRIKDKG